MKVLKSLRNYLTTESGNWYIGPQNTSPPVPEEVYIITMAKALPYFKFFCSEWSDGDITLEDYETQGLFINICSYYWSNECVVELSKLKKRFKKDVELIDLLIKNNMLKTVDNYVVINFLDEQKNDRKLKSITNKDNGSKGGRPKTQTQTENNPIGYNSLTETKANEKAIREDKKREDYNENKFSEKIIELGKYVFKDTFSVDRAIINYSTSLNNLKESFLNFLMSEKYHEKELNDLAMDKMSKHFFRWLLTHQPKKVEHSHADLLEGEWGVDFDLKPTPNDKEAIQELLNDGWVRTKEGMAKRIIKKSI